LTSSKTIDAAGGSSVWQQGDGSATTGFSLASTTYTFPSSSTSQSFSLKTLTANGTAGETTATAAKYALIKITDTTGAITGAAGSSYDVAIAQAGGGATVTSAVSVSAAVSSTVKYTITATTPNAGTITVTGATPVATTVGAISPATITAATGSTLTFTAQVTDQFGIKFAGAAVAASVTSGRNSTKPVVNMVSDSNGYVTYTLTDSGTSGTSDTIQFAGATTVTRTVNYGSVTVGSVTLTGGNTTAGVEATTPVTKDINAGDGAEGTLNTFTATVKDANGALLAGVPVSFTVSGTGAAVLSTTQTVYTGSAGTAAASVYGWVAGKYTVTATAGGKSGTGTITFAQLANGEERAVSATVVGNVVTAKVVDRFGNAVPNVTVYATQAGGVTVNSKTRDSGTTDSTGTVDFLVSGTGDVTVSTLSWAATPGTFASGQTCARAGALDCNAAAADDTTFTAYVAGTSTKAEVGVGSSFSAAGVSSATVSVAGSTASDSVDAANEATDAANAATDAANAAAEAADAATAAAQDAQAAVAALATQVASLIAGIKAQITTLTNLVVKIQKKVKA